MSRTWVNGGPPFLNAANLNALEADVTTALGVPDTALAGRITDPASATQAALNATYASRANNLSDLASAATARTNLGLGDAATHPASDFSGSAAGTAGKPLAATDATTTNARTPTPHASSHGSGGSDAVSLDASQVATGTLASGRIPDQASTYVTKAAGSNDQTIGGMPVQKVTGNKWFQGLNVFGNNTGLAADPRQPTQFNNVIDGSTLNGTTYGGDKVGFVNNVVFKGGFSGEAGYGVIDPTALFGEVVFVKTGSTSGDLAGITAFYAQTSEAHLYTPGASLTTFIGLETVANVESTATGATVTNAYGHHARGPVDNVGGVITNAYSVYIEAPTGGTNKWGLFCAGKAQFTGLTPNTSGSGAPRGAYLGVSSNNTIALELSDGSTNNFRIANDIGGHMSFEKAGSLVLGTFDALGNLAITAGLKTALTTKTSSYTVTSSDSVILASGSGVTITLPSPVTMGAGRRFAVKNKDTVNTVTVATAAGNIDGSSTQTLATSQGHYYVSDGTNWIGMV